MKSASNSFKWQNHLDMPAFIYLCLKSRAQVKVWNVVEEGLRVLSFSVTVEKSEITFK